MLQKIQSNIRHIIWDLDGTLLNSFPIHIDVMGQVLKLHGRPVPSDIEMTRHFHGSLEQSMRGLAGKVSDKEMALMLKDFLRIDNLYIKDVNNHLHPDAVELAKRAHIAGISQIVVTNRAHGVNRGTGSPRNLIHQSVLSHYIDRVICGDEVTIHKPDPAVLNGIEPMIDLATTLVIGDQFIDGEFAHNLGARSVLVNRASDPIVHIECLTDEMREQLTIVSSLNEVQLN